MVGLLAYIFIVLPILLILLALSCVYWVICNIYARTGLFILDRKEKKARKRGIESVRRCQLAYAEWEKQGIVTEEIANEYQRLMAESKKVGLI